MCRRSDLKKRRIRDAAVAERKLAKTATFDTETHDGFTIKLNKLWKPPSGSSKVQVFDDIFTPFQLARFMKLADPTGTFTHKHFVHDEFIVSRKATKVELEEPEPAPLERAEAEWKF